MNNPTHHSSHWHIPSLLPTLLIIAVLCGCTNTSSTYTKLQCIDSLIEVRPDAAYDSLCQFALPDKAGRKAVMKYRMLKAKAANKLYKPLPSDTAFQNVADYYDSHGSANEKMLSQYLMGCIYRDQGDAPESLEHFMNAVACADTTAADCDCYTLSCVYGQMAEIYTVQYFFDKAIECYNAYSRYALKAGRMDAYVSGKEFAAIVICEKGDTLEYFNRMRECMQLYKDNGMPKEAATAMHPLILALLQRQEYDSAHYYMQIYEKESGLFANNIPDSSYPSASYYYFSKGLYYEGIGKLDSAEHFYRGLQKYGYNTEAYRGLLSVYAQRSNADSIHKYMKLYEFSMKKYLERRQTMAVAQANSMYDYSRLKRTVAESKYRDERQQWTFWSTLLAVVAVALHTYIRIRHYRRKKEAEIIAHKDKIAEMHNRLIAATEELKNIQSNTNDVVNDKQEEICILAAKIAKYESLHTDEERKSIVETETMHERFNGYILGQHKGRNLTHDDWDELSSFFSRSHTRLYQLLCGSHLSQQEMQASQLTFLGFSSKEAAILLNVSPQRISNLKALANEKMYGEKSAKSLYSNMTSECRDKFHHPV